MNSENKDWFIITKTEKRYYYFQSIVVSLGYYNAAIDLDIGNGEDKAFTQVIKSFNNNVSIHTKPYLSEL